MSVGLNRRRANVDASSSAPRQKRPGVPSFILFHWTRGLTACNRGLIKAKRRRPTTLAASRCACEWTAFDLAGPPALASRERTNIEPGIPWAHRILTPPPSLPTAYIVGSRLLSLHLHLYNFPTPTEGRHRRLLFFDKGECPHLHIFLCLHTLHASLFHNPLPFPNKFPAAFLFTNQRSTAFI